MGGPAYHGWTHRPKDQGGTDPVFFELSRCHAFHNSTQTVSADMESRLSVFSTNDSDIFELDTTSTVNSSGILIKKLGHYIMMAHLDGTSGASKGAYLQTQPSTSYPTLGNEDDPSATSGPLAVPFNFNTDRLDDAISHVLPDIHIMTIRRISGSSSLPWRTIVGLSKPAADWTVDIVSLSIIKIAGL